tara:strand:+ start:109 stop:738 length:630 start_codon:yes stop_codon:yes gene_type:complete
MNIIELLKKTLDNPVVFNSFERMMGVNKTRETLVREYIRPNKNSLVLDIGCGTGDFRNFLPEDLTYIGIDTSNKYIEFAKKKKFKNSKFYCCGINEISNITDIQKSKFDIIISIGVIHHLDEKLFNDLVEKSFSVLNNDGYLVTYDPVFKDKQNRISRFLIENDRGEYVRNESGYTSILKKIFPRLETFQVNNLQYLPYDVLITKAYKK